MAKSPSPRPGRVARPARPASEKRPASTKRPISAKRLAANQANAKKSTGPRTAAGKGRSRFNAVKHGLTASVGLLPGENGMALHDLSAAVHADLRPRGQAEAVLVDQYVSIAWKLRRLGAAERHVADDALGRDVAKYFDDRDDHDWALTQPGFKERAEACGPPDVPRPTDVAALLFQDLSAGSGPMLRVMDLEMRLRNTLTGVLKQLKELRGLRRQQALEEREAEEDGELGAWEPGEWDYDPARFGRYFDDDGTTYDGAEPEGGPADGEDGDDDGGEGEEENVEAPAAPAPPVAAPQSAAPRNNSAPPAQNEPMAQTDAPPAPAAAQPQAAAPDAPPIAPSHASEIAAPPAETEPTKATASLAASVPPVVTPPLPTDALGDGSIDPGT